MNDKDKEAFDKWWGAKRGANDFPGGLKEYKKEILRLLNEGK